MVVFFFLSCESEDVLIKKYENNIINWYFLSVQDSIEYFTDYDRNKFYLFWDKKLSCKTCEPQIIEILKSFPEVILVSNFETQKEIDFFKNAYKLNNKIYTVYLTSDMNLYLPFAFRFIQRDGEDHYVMKNIFILQDPYLNIESFQNYMELSKEIPHYFSNPSRWFYNLF